jgi:hypothetical protein
MSETCGRALSAALEWAGATAQLSTFHQLLTCADDGVDAGIQHLGNLTVTPCVTALKGVGRSVGCAPASRRPSDNRRLFSATFHEIPAKRRPNGPGWRTRRGDPSVGLQ